MRFVTYIVFMHSFKRKRCKAYIKEVTVDVHLYCLIVLRILLILGMICKTPIKNQIFSCYKWTLTKFVHLYAYHILKLYKNICYGSKCSFALRNHRSIYQSTVIFLPVDVMSDGVCWNFASPDCSKALSVWLSHWGQRTFCGPKWPEYFVYCGE
jgi:hypothetical protein